MKRLFYYLFTLSVSLVAVNQALCQGGAATNAFNGGYLGWNAFSAANPLTIRTNNLARMYINGDIGLTSGFVGIGTTNPQFRLHIEGSQVATGSGWTRAIMISNDGQMIATKKMVKQ